MPRRPLAPPLAHAVLVLASAPAIHCGGATDATPSAADVRNETPTPDPQVAQAPPPPEGERPGELDTLVMQALRTREVRALDVLLATTREAGPMRYTDAVAYCEQLDVERLDGWRLPSVGELASLGNAGLIAQVRDDRRYWSATEADTFGDSRFAWASRQKRAIETTAAEGAYVVCVRRTT